MKRSLILPVLMFIFTSCTISNRIVEINDSYKGINGLRLDQNPKAYSAEKKGTIWGQNVLYPFSSSYIYEESGKNRPDVYVTFQLQAPNAAEELDSALYFKLDGEKIRLVADPVKKSQIQHTSMETTLNNGISNSGETSAVGDSYQLMKFKVPENLWSSIAGAKEIQYRLYIGKEGIDVKLNLPETTKLRKFFSQAGARRNTLFPPIPEGKKKW